MFGLIVFLSGMAFAAWRIAARLEAFEQEPLTRVERGAWFGVLGLGLWLAAGHVLAVAGRFRAGPLIAASVAIAAAALWSTRRTSRRIVSSVAPPPSLQVILPLGLVGACLAYSVASLLVLPVSNHDALSYHFPKAMQLVTRGAFGLYPAQDLRVTHFPDNYEMLVATIMLFLGGDTFTGLVTSGALLLFLATCYGFFRRIWQSAAVAALTLPIVLASPVVFLHVTAHKNDLLMGAATLNALVWLGRFAVNGGSGSAIVGLVALALAGGTKTQGLFALLASVILFWRAWRDGLWRPTVRGAALQGACAAALVLSLGGVQYIANVIGTGKLQGVLQIATPNALNTVAFPAYWQVPRFALMLLAAPVLANGAFYEIPWRGETWFWPAYELYFSHYGLHVTALVLSLPVAVPWAARRLDAVRRSELAGISVTAIALAGLNALVGLRPYGGFAFLPRFLFFALPVLLAWTWCPAVQWMRSVRAIAWVPVAVSLALPIACIRVTVTRDGFAPLWWIEALWVAPEHRRDNYHSPWRAAVVADHMAAADATIAVDAGYDGWTYPLYGARLSRKVETILDHAATYVPPDDVDWVVVDRATSIVWGHPDFQSMSQARQYLDRGPLTDDDRRVFRSLTQNHDFERVYFYPSRFQAIFHRITPRPATD